MLLNSVANVPKRIRWTNLFYPQFKTFPCDFHQFPRFFRNIANDKHSAGISKIAVQIAGNINIHNITALQCLIVWNTMTNDIVQ